MLISCLVGLGWAGLILPVLRSRIPEEDPATRLGVALLAGLLSLGWVTFWIGLVPGGYGIGQFAVAATGLGGLAWMIRSGVHIPKDIPPKTLARGAVPTLAVLVSLIGALAPSTTLDWDSLAYHLAVPKMWLAAGQMQFVSFIHHSNFPFAIDNLFLWGLAWGGESGAKAFSVLYLVAALCLVYGIARQRFGEEIAPWVAAGFASVPAVQWLSGTAYLDVAHAAFVGLAIHGLARFAQTRDVASILYVGLGLSGSLASKYTGLQTAAVLGVIFLFLLRRKSGPPIPWRGIGLAVLSMVVIAGPWYVRNVVNTGNPVYPFFYSVLGGKNWSDFNARIYSHEQQTFGAGRAMASAEQPDYVQNPLEWSRLPHAILGLTYQPGRYINPAPTRGLGLILGTLGFVGVASLFAVLLRGRLDAYDGVTIAAVGLSLGLWFVLSQQSRYIISLLIPLSMLAGSLLRDAQTRRILQASTGVQVLGGFAITTMILISSQWTVAFGFEDRAKYRQATTAFAEPADFINRELKPAKIALYDEVFGFLLDVPYFWANPGHTTELGYADMTTSDQLIANLRRLGISHVYYDLGPILRDDPELGQRLAAAGGLVQPTTPLDPETRARLMRDEGARWRVLLADAMAAGQLRVVRAFGRRFIFEITP